MIVLNWPHPPLLLVQMTRAKKKLFSPVPLKALSHSLAFYRMRVDGMGTQFSHFYQWRHNFHEIISSSKSFFSLRRFTQTICFYAALCTKYISITMLYLPRHIVSVMCVVAAQNSLALLVVEAPFSVFYAFFALLLSLCHSDTETFLCAQNQKKKNEASGW